MTDTAFFHFAAAGFWLVLLVLPAVITLKAWVRSVGLRASVAVAVAWAFSILYTAYVYNPAGIAAGQEQGIDSPQMLYDNNTVSSTILGGWFYPTVVVLLSMAWLRRKGSAQPGASERRP